jgi:MFS family permease
MTTTSPVTSPAPKHTVLPPGAWRLVALLWVAGGSNYLARNMPTTMRGSIVEEITMTEAQFGLLMSGLLWVYAFASPFGGFLADRFNRRSMVLGSFFLWSIITTVTALVENFEQFLALRILLGLSQAFYIPAALALIVDCHRGPTRALAAGIHLTGYLFGASIGGVAGWLAEKHGWSYAYTVMGLPNLVFGVLLYFLLREPPRESLESVPSGSPVVEIKFSEALKSLSKTGPFYVMMAAMCVQGAIGWMIVGWMPTIMAEQFKMGQGAAGFSALGYLYAGQLVGLLGGGFWSDRLSLTNPRSRIIIPALAILLTAPAFLLTGWSPLIIFTIVSLVMWGVAMGCLGANMMPIVCLIVDVRYRATAIGMTNLVINICGGLAIYGVGLLRDAKFGVNLILTFAGFGVFLCGALLWLTNVLVRRNESAKLIV